MKNQLTKENSRVLTVRVPNKLWDEAEDVAEKKYVPFPVFIRQAIKEKVDHETAS